MSSMRETSRMRSMTPPGPLSKLLSPQTQTSMLARRWGVLVGSTVLRRTPESLTAIVVSCGVSGGQEDG